MTLISVLVILLLLLALPALYFRTMVHFYRKQGRYPLKGKVERDNILHLVKERKTLLAMRAYRELHRCGIIEARNAIKQFEKEVSLVGSKNDKN